MPRRKPTHRLFLLRHAKAVQDENPGPDVERPLTKRGRKSARAMRRFLRAKGLVPDIMLVSPSQRTMQTLDGLMPLGDNATVSRRDDLYLATAETIRDAIAQLDETHHAALVIGHNPGMHELATALLATRDAASGKKKSRRLTEAFPTCALAVFDLSGPWSELATAPATLSYFVTPRDLR